MNEIKYGVFRSIDSVNKFIKEKEEQKVLVDVINLQFHAASAGHVMYWREFDLG